MNPRTLKILKISGLVVVGLFGLVVLIKGSQLVMDGEKTENAAPVKAEPPSPPDDPLFEDKARDHALNALTVLFASSGQKAQWPNYLSGGAETASRFDNYYKKALNSRSVPLQIIKIKPIRTSVETIWFCIFEDTKHQIHYCSFQEEEGHLKLHWESMVAWGEMSWADFDVERPTEPIEMRAYLRQLDPEQDPLRPRAGLIPFAIFSRSRAFSSIAWIPTSHPDARELTALPADQDHPVTLKLQYSTSNRDTEYLTIHSLEHLRWLDFSAQK